MIMDQHGTISIALLLTTFIFLLIIGYTTTLISDRFTAVDQSRELVEARSLAENIANSINQAYSGGNGHRVKIKMPAQIQHNYTYHVQVNSTGVLVIFGNRMGIAYIIPKKFSSTYNNLKSSEISLEPGNEYVIINKRDENEENWIVILKN